LFGYNSDDDDGGDGGRGDVVGDGGKGVGVGGDGCRGSGNGGGHYSNKNILYGPSFLVLHEVPVEMSSR